MLKKLISICFLFTVSQFCFANTSTTDDLFRTVIKSVIDNDFALMATTYHPDAVLVSPKKTTPITAALKRWQIEGNKLHAQGGRATLNFRFKKRIVNESTAFDVGIYRYSMIDKSGKEKVYYSQVSYLHVKKDNKWLTMMEHQTANATEEQWLALANWQ